jgi:enoyl-CoA hydratase/carnithine racemase
MKGLNISNTERVLTITINSTDITALCSLLQNAESDREVDFIRLTSESGDFSVGARIETLSAYDEKEARAYAVLGQKLIKTIRNLKKVVIAEVDGDAFGAGFEVALACDFIFATSRSRFGFPEINLGIVPAFGGSQLAARKTYETFAKYLLFTGEPVNSAELYSKGVINSVFADTASMKTHVDDLCKRLGAKSIFMMGLAKETLNNGIEMDFDKALLLEQNSFAFSFACEDKKEGMGAFIEKRKPQFKNRWEDLTFGDD